MKEAEGDPWVDILEKYSVGQSVEGTVEKKEKFGYFVALEPGITGLLPKSKIKDSLEPTVIEKLKEGDPIIVIVGEISPSERKITLGPGDSVAGDDWKNYSKDEEKSMGSLGEKLRAALKSKDE